MLQQECSGQTVLIRTSVLGNGSQASYFNFGARSSLDGLCERTMQQCSFVRYINNFLQHNFPDGCWSSFCVSHNEFAHVHQDQNMVGTLNYTISLGAFAGGHLWVQCSQDDFPGIPLVPAPGSAFDSSLRGKLICTRRQGLAFDGRRLHGSAPWTGDRWVVTAYTAANWSGLCDHDFQTLQSLDFPLPGIPPLVSSTSGSTPEQDQATPVQAPLPLAPQASSFDPGLSGIPCAPIPPPASAVQGNIFLELCSGPNRHKPS